MPCRALLLPPPGDFPFAGHLWLEAWGDQAWISVAASIASSTGPVSAFAPAHSLRAVLNASLQPLSQQSTDRNRLLWALWEAIDAIPAETLGAPGGTDLSLLAIAGDRRGAGVAGVGLSGVWGMYVDAWEPLAMGGHPMLGPAGRPVQMPGALRLTASPRGVLASLAAQPAVLPPADEVLSRAGVRR